jgi:DNA-binding winged helix-turn-helix (wHTH) protein/tetratricopeptide (TPR) repeat protein
MQYAFGPFRADRSAYRVWRGSDPVELTPKLLDLLFYFLDHPATLITKEALLDAVWPGANVTDNALAQAISELRDVLGDQAAAPTYIRTVARRGYRLVATVLRQDEPAGGAPVGPGSATEGARDAIAVLDFVNVTGDADVAWLASGIAETVTSDMAALDRFRVLDRWRVVQAARLAPAPTLHAVGAAVGATFVVAGSFQRAGTQLRITARIVNLESGEAVADAKVDGPLDAVFELQDGIVATFARELGMPGVPSGARVGVRETSSLDAYRAYTEGLLKIESLDTEQVRASVADFERAIACDSGYAMAYTGLANAEFVAYEMSRVTAAPDVAALRSGIEHARRAIQLDDELAEAHATLSFLLVSDLAFEEARAAALRAVMLEPESWRHQYRLGHALWGGARVRALERALSLYPQFLYATFELAMLSVARGELEGAERLVRRRHTDQGHQTTPADRFPAVGFDWLLGALEAVGGRLDSALAQFDRELAHVAPRRLYGPEYRTEALVGRGHAVLALGRAEDAAAAFAEARRQTPGFLRAHLGEALALARLDSRGAARAWAEAEAAVDRRRQAPRHLYARACLAAARQDAAAALADLAAFLDSTPPSYLGWTIPIEPLFAGLRQSGALAPIVQRVADRARQDRGFQAFS